jgi:1-acyl-sn-glycerol-3-phosphate acyltransferase
MHIDIPSAIPRTNSLLGRCIGKLFLKLTGWQIKGAFPNMPKFVAAVAPHTSNWDFFIALAVKLACDLEVKFLGKHTIFFWPFSVFLEKWGGIAVNRTSAQDVVSQVANKFAHQDQLILGIAPEGTRKYKPEWKSGFLRIAYAAGVPVVPMAIDFSTKTFIVMPAINLTGELDVDLAQVKSCFNQEMAKYPDNLSG